MRGLKTLLVVFFLGITSTAFAQVEIVPKLTYRPFFGMIDGMTSLMQRIAKKMYLYR